MAVSSQVFLAFKVVPSLKKTVDAFACFAFWGFIMSALNKSLYCNIQMINI